MAEKFKELTPDELRNLSPAEQKDYIVKRMEAQGASDFSIDKLGETTPVERPPEEPVEEEQKPPPDETADLSPSQRGELAEIDGEPVPQQQEGEAPDEEMPSQPKSDKEFLRVSEDTYYNSKDDAIRGIQEKDRTIRERTEALNAEKDRTKQLLERLDRLENEFKHLSQTGKPAQEQSGLFEEQAAKAKPRQAAAQQEAEEAPTADELIELFDSDQGPLASYARGFRHLMHSDPEVLELKRMINELAEFKRQLESTGITEMAARERQSSLLADLDSSYPELGGLWHQDGHPMQKHYLELCDQAEAEHRRIYGYSLQERIDRSADQLAATKDVISDILDRIDPEAFDQPKGQAPAKANGSDASNGPAHTTHEVRRNLTEEDLRRIARESAQKATEAVLEQGRLYGGAETAGVASKRSGSSLSDAQGRKWTSEEISKNPSKWWNEVGKNDPAYANATLDILSGR